MKKVDFGFLGIIVLLKKFGLFVYVFFRNYIFKINKCCILLILDLIQNKIFNKLICLKRNLFYLKFFILEFGKINLFNKFSYDWDFI